MKFEAERALLVVLKNEVGRKQIELRQNIYRKTRHLMFTREDGEEKSWLAELERYEHRWKEELAARRRKKFSKLLGNQAKWRRRALSKEAISDLRRYVTDCMEFNEEISRTSKNEGSAKNLEDLVSQRVEHDEDEIEKGNMNGDDLEFGNQPGETNACVVGGINIEEQITEQSKFVPDNVVNLSRRVLTSVEISLLSKGLKFCPTPVELDFSAVKRDIKEFGRKLKSRSYF